MVFVCDHCHYDFERLTKTTQCPDCGKKGFIRLATRQEAEEYEKRKQENVWDEPVAVWACS